MGFDIWSIAVSSTFQNLAKGSEEPSYCERTTHESVFCHRMHKGKGYKRAHRMSEVHKAILAVECTKRRTAAAPATLTITDS